MEIMTTERIVKIVPYRELNEKVREKVVSTFRSWLNEVYKILVFKKQIHEMFDQLNTLVEFYVEQEHGTKTERKLFRIDDTDERIAKFLAEQFHIASVNDPGIKDKILLSMVKRNEGNERLIIK
jgi:hypothetical protein